MLSLALLLLVLAIGQSQGREGQCSKSHVARELGLRRSENKRMGDTMQELSKCQTLTCTLRLGKFFAFCFLFVSHSTRTERQLGRQEKRVLEKRESGKRMRLSDCQQTTVATTHLNDDDEETNAPTRLQHGCNGPKEVKVRRKENESLLAVLSAAAKCNDLECSSDSEELLRNRRAEIRKTREARSLACLSKKPGVAVADTVDAPKSYGISKEKDDTLASESSMCCMVREEGVCVDYEPNLSQGEAQTSCRMLCESYDANVKDSFFVHRKCKREGAVGVCLEAQSTQEEGTIIFFAPVSVQGAKRHCKRAQGSFEATQVVDNLVNKAQDVARMEAESVGAFSKLLDGARVNDNGTVVIPGRNGAAGSSGDLTPGWGSQQFRIVGAIFLFIFIALFAAAATMLYIKSSVESKHRQRRVGEGYIKVPANSDAEPLLEKR